MLQQTPRHGVVVPRSDLTAEDIKTAVSVDSDSPDQCFEYDFGIPPALKILTPLQQIEVMCRWLQASPRRCRTPCRT